MVGRDCSPTLVTPESTLPLVLGVDGQEEDHFSLLHATIWQMKGGLDFLSIDGKGVSSLIS